LGLFAFRSSKGFIMLKNITAAYNEAVFDTDRDKALAIIHDAVRQGVRLKILCFRSSSPQWS
jgi:uncharacterized protein (DUF58 family)